MSITLTSPDTDHLRYYAYGKLREAMECRAREVVTDGPAGTGKTLMWGYKLHACALKYPGARIGMFRKTNTALAATAIVTFESKVLFLQQGNPFHVTYFGGSQREPASYRYPNGSRIIIGGLDNPDKVMSAEYDLIYVNEATELTLNDWEALLSRLRNGVMPYQQLCGDCNPQGSTHWLKLRMDAGLALRFKSSHEDNPRFYDRQRGAWTAEGIAYVQETLGSLTGVRRERLLGGIWANAEGAVYGDVWDASKHVIPRFEIPRSWPRYLVIDFGYTHPFVAQWWALDEDGRMYRYREIYRSQRLVEDHCADILREMGYELKNGRPTAIGDSAEPLPYAVICDHDAEDRATCERYLGMTTIAAKKDVREGIQNISSRLRPAGDGRARLFLLENSLVERDPLLSAVGKPCSTEEEMDGYIWAHTANGESKEEPVKRDDHGNDAMRYHVQYHDAERREVQYAHIPGW